MEGEGKLNMLGKSIVPFFGLPSELGNHVYHPDNGTQDQVMATIFRRLPARSLHLIVFERRYRQALISILQAPVAVLRRQ